jgi:hypothetical protein
MQDICKRLYDDGLHSDENRKWYVLCQEWIEKRNQKRYEVIQDENIMNGKKIKINRFLSFIRYTNRVVRYFEYQFFQKQKKENICISDHIINHPKTS